MEAFVVSLYLCAVVLVAAAILVATLAAVLAAILAATPDGAESERPLRETVSIWFDSLCKV